MSQYRLLLMLCFVCVAGLTVLLLPGLAPPSPAQPPVTTMPVERPAVRSPLDLGSPGLKGEIKTSGGIAQSSPAEGNALALDANALAKDPDVQAVVKANNQFAIDLYKEIAKTEKGNIFFSPFSISCALAMVYAGARGQTAEEMAKVLHFPPELTKDNGRRLHVAYGKLLRHLNPEAFEGKGRGYDLLVANAIWVRREDLTHADEQRLAVWKAFEGLTRERYGAEANQVEFGPKAEETRRMINEWVECKTERRIMDLLPDGSLGELTRMVLTNAVYFQGDWARAFKKERTQEEDFNVTTGKRVKVRMMHQVSEFRVWLGCEGGGSFPKGGKPFYALVEMPYAGDGLSMLIAMPRKIDGLSSVEDALSWDFPSIGDDFGHRQVDLSMPAFRTSWGGEVSGALRKIGMEVLFNDSANLSGMGVGGSCVSGVHHKAFVDVSEKGTEAAAATAVVISIPVGFSTGNGPFVFRVDQPFLFFIRDKTSGAILFQGRVLDPTPR